MAGMGTVVGVRAAPRNRVRAYRIFRRKRKFLPWLSCEPRIEPCAHRDRNTASLRSLIPPPRVAESVFLWYSQSIMLQSRLFTRTLREAPKGEEAANAKLLTRGGFVYKNSAGIYTYLPLGWRVMQRIAGIIREEMDAIGGEEFYMPALHDKHYLQATGRWNVNVVFKVISGTDKEPAYNISWTHEEIMAEIARKYVSSYKDLPFSAYQIQTKFRDEPRAKSGILRGREFSMKDLYSFHVSEEDLYRFYNIVKGAYFKIFARCGLKAYYTLAAGGEFTANNTHEFQVLSPVGEDTIFYCKACGYAENKEISKLKDGTACPACGGTVREGTSIEVGNIFPLGTKYSEAFDLTYMDEHGEKRFVVMGSYGIGLGRVMGTIVEVFHDERGMVWPASVAPFDVHLVELPGASGRRLYDDLQARGFRVLYDERSVSAGEKFADADLIGIPWRFLVSEKTGGKVEVRRRGAKEADLVETNKAMGLLSN